MSAQHLRRPAEGESDPYYRGYINQVPEGDYFALSRQQLDDTCRMLESLPPERQNFRYAPGKWSVKQVLGHILDTEWVFSYRAMCMARGRHHAAAGHGPGSFCGRRQPCRPLHGQPAE